MARDLYGIPDALLLEEREAAQRELLRGMATTSFGDGGSQGSQQIIFHARSRIREINAELAARGHPEAPAEITTPNDFTTIRYRG